MEFFFKFKQFSDGQSTRVLITAGQLGWKSVFFEELKNSAEEIVGHGKVFTLSIDKNFNHYKQMRSAFELYTPTHVIYDPRSGPQEKITALIDAIRVKIALNRFNITPIVILPDAGVRQHRHQAILLSGSKGVVITFLSYELTKKYFAGIRCIGPSPIPISRRRYAKISGQFKPFDIKSEINFVGSNYPKRQEFFSELENQLSLLKSEIKVIIQAKSQSTDNEAYWEAIDKSPVIVTTTFQTELQKLKLDFYEINQMVFRISEALARQKLLFCMQVPGIEEYFEAGVDYVEFSDALDLATKLVFYSEREQLQRNIAISGHKKFTKLQESGEFWKIALENTTKL
jgi:hypothetical protein